ncbi:Mur ligase family protein [Effusibacillus lacus]|uniref:UDP-N-acetylmuramyl peptide synthase n=1 Tax=Effusibacillus lacus TaxID=1348429 RepID=A0A292YS35_9BACL|nr:UDP-N-acetylmuramyl-tripeptide synthetase [Effusibacillus lacus]TCS74910.1 UDP-N-acetylmuramoylalanyl-D-glutamate--2,6-diaminopimelate ligase [Effusibacillus lacus]GAX91583.1 UDP-N-acetylmuramyl peptide synthase [Effusibacillus lacus]
MKVEALLAAIRNGAVQLAGITHDSRQVQPGYAFVAISGKHRDGHTYIEEAVRKGAACIVCEKKVSAPIPVYRTESPRRWLSRLSAAVHRDPSSSLNVIGVTGSNGKTTITSMIHSLFVENGLPCGLIGTVENDINGVRTPATLTTPEAPDLQRMLAELLAGDTRNTVMEVSAQGVEMGRVEDIHFSLGIFTNLTPDHLDFYASLEEYGECKKRFMNRIPGDKTGLYNYDDPYVREAAREGRSEVFTYSLVDRNADLSAQIVGRSGAGCLFFLHAGSKLRERIPCDLESFPFVLRVPGLHNVSNALAALLAGLLSGLNPLRMRLALNKFRPVVRRMQVFDWNGVKVVDDTAMNPGSIRAVMNTFQSESCGRVFIVFAIRGNRGTVVNRENALALAECYSVWKSKHPQVIITSAASHVGDNDLVHPEEENVFLSTLWEQKIPHTFYRELPEAMEHLAQSAHTGDLLFLLGAQGMDEGFSILSHSRKIKDLVK